MDTREMDTFNDIHQLNVFIRQHDKLNLYAIINGCRFQHFERFLYQIEPDPQYCSLFEGTEFHEVQKDCTLSGSTQ